MNRKKISKIVLTVLPSHTHYVVQPIGLGYLATALRKEGYSDILILDALKEKLDEKQLEERLVQLAPDMIGFQVYSYDFQQATRCIQALKKRLPKTIMIMGGPHVSAVGKPVLQSVEAVDFAFVGEAEPGLPLLMHYLNGHEGLSLEDIPGLIYRTPQRPTGSVAKDSSFIQQNPRAVIDDLDALGIPAWDLMVPAEYPDNPQGGFYRRYPIASISTTRGCPYRCSFCGSAVNMGRKLRVRSMPMVLKEMGLLYHEYGVGEFHIIDDMFNHSKERVREFCKAIRENQMTINYTFPNGLRLNQLDREMLQMMKETGAYAFNVGIESGSQRILDEIHKSLTLELIEEKVKLIVEMGLEPCGFFIVGMPGETVEDIKATIRFALKLPLRRAHFSNFLPLPGTELTGRLIDNHEIEAPNWNELFYSKVAYSPPGISKRQLKALQRKAYLSFYLRPSILFKMLADIKSMNHLKLTLKRVWDYLFKS